MLRIVFTLDYEINGDGQGCPQALMVEPTDRLLRLFDAYGAKLTIMAEVAEIMRFKQYKDAHGEDRFHYEAIARQLRRAIETGHDVQLHIHSSYFNARGQGDRWAQDWSEYDFASLPYERMNWMIGTSKRFLEALLQPVDPGYRCLAFRAANWSVSPSRNVVHALVDNGIEIDTSVFKYGHRSGIVNFDYAHADSALAPWPVSEDDICLRDEHGALWEVPIYSEKRWLGAFVSPGRIHRAIAGWGHRIADPVQGRGPASRQEGAPAQPRSRRRWLWTLLHKHAWKADFNQCGGRQLIGALRRAERRYDNGHAEAEGQVGRVGGSRQLPFVLIGHSKLFTRRNEESLRPFLAHSAARPECFGFDTLARMAGAGRSGGPA